MQIKTDTPIRFYDTEVPVVFDGKPGTIGALIRSVMNAKTSEAWTPETLLRCGELATRAVSGSPVDFNDSEREFIKERAAVVYASADNGPFFYGLLVDALPDSSALTAVPADEQREEEAS